MEAKKIGRGGRGYDGRTTGPPYGRGTKTLARRTRLDKRGDETESLGKSGESLDQVKLDFRECVISRLRLVFENAFRSHTLSTVATR